MNRDFLPTKAVVLRNEPMDAGHHLFTFLPEQEMTVEPGQFFEISLPGLGGFPVSPCDLVRGGELSACIRRAGRVTEALFRRKPGEEIGLRGPFGNGFPPVQNGRETMLLIAGGLGVAPLMALLRASVETPGSTKPVFLYGARNFEGLLFREELVRLAEAGAITLHLSVDEPCPRALAEDSRCRIGPAAALLEGLEIPFAESCAVTCGPPALYRVLLEELATLGVPAGSIHATLERRMRCGVGVCCHCVAGDVFVCSDGPVFSLEQLRRMEGAL